MRVQFRNPISFNQPKTKLTGGSSNIKSSEGPPVPFSVSSNLEDINKYHVISTIRAHIEGLMADLPIRYVKDNGDPGARGDIKDIIDSITPQSLGSFAADIKILGNGFLKWIEDDRGLRLEYHSAMDLSPAITVQNGAYVLHGFRRRRATTADIKNTINVSIASNISNSLNSSMVTWAPGQIIHAKLGTHDKFGSLLGKIFLSDVIPLVAFDSKENNITLEILHNLRRPSAVARFQIDPDTLADGTDFDKYYQEQQMELERAFYGKNGGIVTVKHEFDMKEMSAPVGNQRFKDLYRRSEFRICAEFGLDSALVGFQSGMEFAPWSHLQTLREYEFDKLIAPLAKIIGDALTEAFGLTNAKESIIIDTSGISVLQEDEDAKVDREIKLVQAGIKTRQQAAESLGIEYQPEGDSDESEQTAD